MVKYIYICSAGHSGSTLLDMLLGSHSKMFSLGEISHLPKNIALNTPCSCGQSVLSCPLWSKVIESLNKDLHLNIYEDPYLFDLGFIRPVVVKDKIHDSWQYNLRRKLYSGLNYYKLKYNILFLNHFLLPITKGIRNNFILFDIVRNLTGRQIVVDSTKDYKKGINLYMAKPEEVRIILLSRDGRGFLFSNLKRNLFNRKVALNSWMRYYNRALPLLKKHVHKDHMIRVKYEALTINPMEELSRICKFFGVDFEKSMLNFASHVHHITNGNNTRFSKSSEIRTDFAWKEKLTPDDFEYFEKIAGSLNQHLGHEI